MAVSLFGRDVSNGFIWSNLVDRAWLFGGKPLQENQSVKDGLWRFEMGDGSVEWTRLDAGDNVTNGRLSHGAEDKDNVKRSNRDPKISGH